MNVIYLIIVMHLFYFGFLDVFNEDIQWVAWDVINLITQVLFALLVFNLIRYRNKKYKILSFIIIITQLWMLMQYSVLTVSEYFVDISIVYNLLNGLFVVIFIPLLGIVIFRSYETSSRRYFKDKSYIAYKNPKNIQGLIASLITLPFGSCCFISNGYKYAFKQGKIYKSIYVNEGGYIYRLAKNVDQEELDKLVGSNWSIRDNCFTVFNKFK